MFNCNNTKKTKDFFKSRDLIKFLGRIWSLLFLIGVVCFFLLIGINLFTLNNIQNILLASVHILIVGIGLTFVIISGGLDISSAYVVGLASVLGALIMREMYAANFNQVVCILIGILGGLLSSLLPGFVNGLIIAKIKIPPFITTLGMMVIVQGTVLLITGGQAISKLPPLIGKWGNRSLLYYVSGYGLTFSEPISKKGTLAILSTPVIVIIILVLIMNFILSKTVFGQHIYAVGGNLEAAKSAGIPVDRIIIKAYTLASLMYGITGLVYVARFTVATPMAGEPLLMSAIAAVFIGGASIGGGKGSVRGTVLGAILVSILQTGLVIAGISPFWQYIAVGIVVIIAVIFDQIKIKLLQE